MILLECCVIFSMEVEMLLNTSEEHESDLFFTSSVSFRNSHSTRFSPCLEILGCYFEDVLSQPLLVSFPIHPSSRPPFLLHVSSLLHLKHTTCFSLPPSLHLYSHSVPPSLSFCTLFPLQPPPCLLIRLHLFFLFACFILVLLPAVLLLPHSVACCRELLQRVG